MDRYGCVAERITSARTQAPHFAEATAGLPPLSTAVPQSKVIVVPQMVTQVSEMIRRLPWREHMGQFRFATLSSEIIERPACPKCGKRMMLARIEPDKPYL
jgi:hypothetical protein